MPNHSGLDIIKEIDQNIDTIFITAHSEYAVESYNLDAVDYLLKPFEYERFIKAITKVLAKRSSEKVEEKFLLIRSEYRLIKINLSEILHIESQADYLTIFLLHQKPIVTRMTMKDMLDLLDNSNFIRVHRSFIVPTSKINIIRDKKLSWNI